MASTVEDVRISSLVNPTPKQRECIEATDIYRFVLYGGAAGGGKRLKVDEPIATPDGWSTVGELKISNEIFADDGSVCKVLGKSPVVYDAKQYRITFDDGSVIEADADHVWSTWTANERNRRHKLSDEYRSIRRAKRKSRAVAASQKLGVSKSITKSNREREYAYKIASGLCRTTQEIFETQLTYKGAINHAVEVAGALQLPDVSLPIHPYVLGAWLGDGTKGNSYLTGIDPEIWEKIEACGFRVTHLANGKTHNIWGLRVELRKINALTKESIPTIYRRASVEQRLDLLRGLMDTDGHAAKDGQAEFCNTRKWISDLVYELIVSLGVKATRRTKRAMLNGKYCGEVFNVYWTHTLPVFHLSRKLERLPKSLRETSRYRYIVKVERCESAPMQCIQVTSQSEQYLCGESMIPTHNSYLLRWWCLRQLLKRFAETGIKGLTVGLFSLDYPTLQDRQISKIEREFPDWLGQTKRTEKEGLCFFVREEFGGGRIALRNLQDPNSYKSAEFCDIAVEELTENLRDVFEDLVLFRLRTPGIDRPCFLGATNPTGAGLQWVKALWVDRKFAPELQHLKHEFGYVPALLKDNPHLGAEYEQSLRGLPEKKRRALLDGDWTIPEGQYFINFEESERKVKHAVMMQIIQPWWPRWISQDWGYKHASPVHWHTTGNVSPEQARLLGREWDSPRKCVFTYREHIATLADTDTSEAELGEILAAKSAGEKIETWILSSDAFGKKTSQNTAAELLKSGAIGFPEPQPANMEPGSRVVGWRFVSSLISSDTWFLSDMCPEAISAIPALEYDKDKGGEDVLKTDHLYDDVGDELRYGLVDKLGTKGVPLPVRRAEIAAQYVEDGVIVDPTELALAMQRFNSEHRNKGRRRAKWSAR